MTKTILTCCAVALLAAALAAQPRFGSARYVPEGDTTDARIQAHGDLDGDGDVDFVALRRFNPLGFHVFLNDGDGGVTAGPLVPYPAQWFVPSFGALRGPLVDVTGDGLVDFVQAFFDAGYQLAIYPGDGVGGFGAPLFGSLGIGSFWRFAFADVSGGSAAEIAIAMHDADLDEFTFRWWSWNGASLDSSSAAVLPKASLFGLDSITAMDFDGDLVPDIVVGDGDVELAHVYPTVAGAPTSTLAPIAVPVSGGGGVEIHAGDVDGDGDDDFVAIDDDQVRPVFVESGVTTLGPISTLGNLDFESYHGDPFVFDWDQDGDNDLLRHSTNNQTGFGAWPYLGVFLNDGSHQFTLGARYRTDEEGDGSGLVDVDDDGFLDFVAPRAFVLGDGTARTSPLRTIFGGLAQVSPGEMAFPDVGNDGDLDMIQGEDTEMLLNDGTGLYSSDFGDLIDISPPAPKVLSHTVAVGDLSGDGRTDLLMRVIGSLPGGEDMALVVDDAGTFTYAGPGAPPGVDITTPQGRMLPVADVDNDGDLDVLNTDGYWTNDGTGYLDAFLPEFTGFPASVGDIEPDGDLDLLLVRPNGNIQIRRNLGGGDYGNAFVVDNQPNLDGFGAFADLDDDGDLDIAVGEGLQGTGVIHLYTNDGWPTWTPSSLTGQVAEAHIFGVTDVDGDGITDLLTASRYDTVVFGSLGPSEPKVQYFRRTDPGAPVYADPEIYVGGGARAFLDVDQDGDLDVVGGQIVHNRRFDGPDDGTIQQYGTAVSGSGGADPLIGGTGPFRPGSTTATLRLRNAGGGATSFLFFGLDRAEIPGLFLGGTLWVTPILLNVLIPLGGTPGAPGEGEWDVPLDGLLDIVAGFPLTFQVLVFDPGALVGKASTGGLEIVFGL